MVMVGPYKKDKEGNTDKQKKENFYFASLKPFEYQFGYRKIINNVAVNKMTWRLLPPQVTEGKTFQPDYLAY